MSMEAERWPGARADDWPGRAAQEQQHGRRGPHEIPASLPLSIPPLGVGLVQTVAGDRHRAVSFSSAPAQACAVVGATRAVLASARKVSAPTARTSGRALQHAAGQNRASLCLKRMRASTSCTRSTVLALGALLACLSLVAGGDTCPGVGETGGHAGGGGATVAGGRHALPPLAAGGARRLGSERQLLSAAGAATVPGVVNTSSVSWLPVVPSAGGGDCAAACAAAAAGLAPVNRSTYSQDPADHKLCAVPEAASQYIPAHLNWGEAGAGRVRCEVRAAAASGIHRSSVGQHL